MPQAIEELLDFLSLEKAAAGNTVAAYRNDLRQSEDHITSRLPQQFETSWESVGRAMLQDFILELERRGYTKSSVARKAPAVRCYLYSAYVFFIASPIPQNNNRRQAVADMLSPRSSTPATSSRSAAYDISLA